MPTIIGNPYQKQSSLGDTIAALGKSMFGDTLTPAIRREQLYALQRKNVETNALADLFRGGDLNPSEAAATALLAGVDPRHLGGYNQFSTVLRKGYQSPDATNAMMAVPGADYGNTYAGAQDKLSTQRYGYDTAARQSGINNAADNARALEEARMKPMAALGPNGQPTFATVGTLNAPNAGGFQPVLSEADRKGTILAGLNPNDQRTAALGAQAFEPTETILGQNGPQIVPRTQSYGQTPVLGTDQFKGAQLQQNWGNLNPSQQNRALGLESVQAPEVYNVTTADGRQFVAEQRPEGFVDVNTRQVIPNVASAGKLVASNADALNPTANVMNGLVQSRTNVGNAVRAIDELAARLGSADAAQSVGYIGTGARWFNDMRAQVEAASQFLNGSSFQQEMASPGVAQAISSVSQRLAADPAFTGRMQQLGIDNSILQSRIADLAYMIAKAREPGGRLTTQDVDSAARTIGAALMDPKAVVPVLDDLKNRLVGNQAEYERQLKAIYGNRIPDQGGAAPAAPATPGAPAPQPAAPAPDPLGIR